MKEKNAGSRKTVIYKMVDVADYLCQFESDEVKIEGSIKDVFLSAITLTKPINVEEVANTNSDDILAAEEIQIKGNTRKY